MLGSSTALLGAGPRRPLHGAHAGPCSVACVLLLWLLLLPVLSDTVCLEQLGILAPELLRIQQGARFGALTSPRVRSVAGCGAWVLVHPHTRRVASQAARVTVTVTVTVTITEPTRVRLQAHHVLPSGREPPSYCQHSHQHTPSTRHASTRTHLQLGPHHHHAVARPRVLGVVELVVRLGTVEGLAGGRGECGYRDTGTEGPIAQQ